MFRVLDELRPGAPYDQVRALVLAAGWRPAGDYAGTAEARCEGETWVCRRHPEAYGCWQEKGTRCGFEFVGTRRPVPRLSDGVLRIQAIVAGDGSLTYRSHDTTSYGGNG